jgi:hypothetical protein
LLLAECKTQPPADSESKDPGYSVSYEAGQRLSQQDWLAVERDQLSEHTRSVTAALLKNLDEFSGIGGNADTKRAHSYAVLDSWEDNL